MEPLVYDSISCFFAEAVKDVQGVTARAQTQPTPAWHVECWPLKGDGPCTQSQGAESRRPGPNGRLM